MVINEKRGQPKKAIPLTQTDNETSNINDFIFNLQTVLPEEEIIISIQGKNVGSINNAVVITGKPKSRKSVVAHAVIGAALSKAPCLGIECNILNGDVILIDTEQSKHDLFKSLTRMKHLINLQTFPEALKVYSFRPLNPEQIKKGISEILQTNKKVKLIIIDGGLDLINNMNDIEETKQTIDFIKGILSSYNICLVMILHQSKSTNFTIGHFGSFMDRFAQSNIQVTKDDKGNSSISSQMMRSDADFQSFDFYYNYNVNNYTISYLENTEIALQKPHDLGNDKHLIKLQKIFAYKNEFLYKDLIIVCSIEYKKTANWCKGLIVYLFDQNLIEKTENGIILKKDANDTAPF
jgi:hypothetical protein